MRVIARKFLEEAKQRHPTARSALDHWYQVTRAASWTHFAQTRNTFPHADQVTVHSTRTVTVFNITSHFRLITAIHYKRSEIYTLRFLTHADYDKENWKVSL